MIERVIGKNTTHDGFSDVLQVGEYVINNGVITSSDTLYERALSNGDISEDISQSFPSLKWIDIPFGSSSPQSFSVNASFQLSTMVAYDTISEVLTNAGTTSLSVKGTTMTANVVTINGTGRSSDTTDIPNAQTNHQVYSIPSKGILDAGGKDISNLQNAASTDLTTTTLIDYTILP